MADEAGQSPTEVERITAELQARVEKERAAGEYADDLSEVELERPSGDHSPLTAGFDLGAPGPRVQFRPELGFSSKRVVGPGITQVKRFLLRLQLYVFDDLARQADAAIRRVENALAVEIQSRERLERELDAKMDELRREMSLLRKSVERVERSS